MPVSLVPLILVSLVGLNVTEIVQGDFAATELSQVLAVTANEPDAAIEVMPNATELGLVTVTVLAAEMVSTATLPNESEPGLMSILPATPVPLKATDATLGGLVESVKTRLADRAPSAAGVKTTDTSQLLPLARVEVQVVAGEVKSPESAPVIEKFNSVIAVPFLGIENLTVFALEVSPVTPKITLPKLILVGDALGAVEAAIATAAGASKSNREKLRPAIGRVNNLLKRIDRLLSDNSFRTA